MSKWVLTISAEHSHQDYDQLWDFRIRSTYHTRRLCVLWGENLFSFRRGFRRVIGGVQFRAEFNPKHTLTVLATSSRNTIYDRDHNVWRVVR